MFVLSMGEILLWERYYMLGLGVFVSQGQSDAGGSMGWKWEVLFTTMGTCGGDRRLHVCPSPHYLTMKQTSARSAPQPPNDLPNLLDTQPERFS